MITSAPSDAATVLDGGGRSNPEPDDALRAALKAAIDAGDLARATALLEILKATPKIAPVLVLAKPKAR